KFAGMRASALGAASAAPTPCTVRAASRYHSAVARPPTSEARPKTAMPVTKTQRWPRMSPARPPSSSKPPKASAYELITQDRPLAVKLRSAWILGSATYTTVLSSTTINWQAAMIAMTAPRREVDAPGAGAVLIGAVGLVDMAVPSWSAKLRLPRK